MWHWTDFSVGNYVHWHLPLATFKFECINRFNILNVLCSKAQVLVVMSRYIYQLNVLITFEHFNVELEAPTIHIVCYQFMPVVFLHISWQWAGKRHWIGIWKFKY